LEIPSIIQRLLWIYINIQRHGKTASKSRRGQEKKFREITERMFGKKKGALSIAGEIAIREWISRNDTQIRF